jgi:hypothetical protein
MPKTPWLDGQPANRAASTHPRGHERGRPTTLGGTYTNAWGLAIIQPTLPDDRTAVEALVTRQIKRHGGDVEKSLGAVPAGKSTCESLARLGDP